jgi:cell division protein FtsW (lipid II flippase)
MVGLMSRDMGTALVMALVVFGILFLTGVPMELLRWPITIGIGAAGIGLLLAGSRIARFQAWLSPGTDDATPYDWQSEHGIWALAAGRLNGVGLGNSKLKWSWIPEVDNDYIFAIIGEEWGWIGATLIIVLFVLIINRIRMISLETKQTFERMLVLGIMVWIAVQTMVNIAVVIKWLPVLGVPLPLISSGGSSLIATMLAIGVVLAVDRENHGITPKPLRLRGMVRAR